MESPDKTPFLKFRKRDGMIVPFTARKIATAIYKAGQAAAEQEGRPFTREEAEDIAADVIRQLDNPLCEYYVQSEADGSRVPNIEDVQDVVEITLSEHRLPATVAAYKRYREPHTSTGREDGRHIRGTRGRCSPSRGSAACSRASSCWR